MEEKVQIVFTTTKDIKEQVDTNLQAITAVMKARSVNGKLLRYDQLLDIGLGMARTLLIGSLEAKAGLIKILAESINTQFPSIVQTPQGLAIVKECDDDDDDEEEEEKPIDPKEAAKNLTSQICDLIGSIKELRKHKEDGEN